MKVGVTLPLSDIGGGPATVRLFAEAAEAAGYDHLAALDHVLGVNAASWPGARGTPRPISSAISTSICGFARGAAWSAGIGRSAARRYVPCSFEGGHDG